MRWGLSGLSSGCSENGMVRHGICGVCALPNQHTTNSFLVPKLGAGVCIDLTVALCCIVSITQELDDLECDSDTRVTL